MLWNLGRQEHAVAAIQNAVGFYRRLAAANVKFEPSLAYRLRDLGGMLWKLGRLEDALAAVEEAVEVQHGLGAFDARFEPHLADTLQKLSTVLQDLGRPEEPSAVVKPAGRPHRDGGKDLVRRNRSAFIVLLRDNDDANALARLLSDVQLPESKGYALFSAPPLRGLDFFAASDLANWSDENIPPDATTVYLLAPFSA
jgi:tetratricopeptide (TPR) repeat protein